MVRTSLNQKTTEQKSAFGINLPVDNKSATAGMKEEAPKDLDYSFFEKGDDASISKTSEGDDFLNILEAPSSIGSGVNVSSPADNGIDPKGSATNANSSTNGINATVLNLSENEKSAVISKLKQLQPNYNLLDNLIKTILSHGGEREMEKVRKLFGMVH